jgi:hypothetical protein
VAKKDNLLGKKAACLDAVCYYSLHLHYLSIVAEAKIITGMLIKTMSQR